MGVPQLGLNGFQVGWGHSLLVWGCAMLVGRMFHASSPVFQIGWRPVLVGGGHSLSFRLHDVKVIFTPLPPHSY